MKLDKNTILELIRSQSGNDRAESAKQELPDEVDTDKEEDRNLLQRFGIDPSNIQGLLDKLPQGVRDKLPGGIGKLLG